MAYLILAALVFGVCYLIDKGFAKLFRNKAQHRTGLAVKHNKHAALFGLCLAVLGVAGVAAGIRGGMGLLLMSLVVLLMAAGLLVYYLSFGIYYDEEEFLFCTFGKKDESFRFDQIQSQLLYVLQGGAMIVELHMADGRTVGVQTNMDGAYPFLDHAFAAWCRQKGIDPETCEFHDPAQCRWFPETEVA